LRLKPVTLLLVCSSKRKKKKVRLAQLQVLVLGLFWQELEEAHL